ncbi:hypothetical protein ACFOWM_09045 [Ferruginibacter yonginensis]|uniref:Uncharacterized protein n=1 Tax=Ferruginibacter yonginensis TaxID=1310416 RepID=A0ABV8QRY3_9BACT
MNVSDSKQLIAADLETLALLLNTYGIGKNINVVYDASANCKNDSTDDFYKYSLEELNFDISSMSHTIPTEAILLTVSISLHIEGRYIDKASLFNPLNNLQVDIICRGSKNEINDLVSAWHLDRHEAINQGGIEEGENKFFHPMYHLTFGGKNMWAFGMDNFGSSLIYPSPRLVHLPLDAALAIDFVIRNFIPLEERFGLMNDNEYKRIISNSQLRIWRPFLQGMLEHWNYLDPYLNKEGANTNTTLYLPNLVLQ